MTTASVRDVTTRQHLRPVQLGDPSVADTAFPLTGSSEMSLVPSAQRTDVGARQSPYSVKAGDLHSDQAAITGLWRDGGLGPSQDAGHAAARYRWFYQSNPQGLARVYLLWSEVEAAPVGSLALGARHLLVGGQCVDGGVLVDFVVVPKHRSALPALTLQRRSREQALPFMPLIYGLPDTKAVAVCKRLPTHVELPLQRWVRVVRSRAYLDRMLPPLLAAGLGAFTDGLDRAGMWLQTLLSRLSCEWVGALDESFDDLWSKCPKTGVCLGVRDRAFLQWRFFDKPSGKPLVFAVRSRNSNELRMYFVCELHASFLAVKDFLNVGSERELKHGLLLLAAAARRRGASAVSIEVIAGESTRRALRRAQYVRRSERPFFAVMDDSIVSGAAGCEWFITQADEDV